jgi:ribulose-phosphate 3-epimerase
MTVEPGFGGQAFMGDMVERIATIFDMRGGEAEIEVDGGLNGDTVVRCARAGANAIVAGSYVFAAENRKARLDALREGWLRGSARFQLGLQHSQDELETVE